MILTSIGSGSILPLAPEPEPEQQEEIEPVSETSGAGGAGGATDEGAGETSDSGATAETQPADDTANRTAPAEASPQSVVAGQLGSLQGGDAAEDATREAAARALAIAVAERLRVDQMIASLRDFGALLTPETDPPKAEPTQLSDLVTPLEPGDTAGPPRVDRAV